MAQPARCCARWRRIPGPPRDPVKARLLRLYRALLGALRPAALVAGAHAVRGRRGRDPHAAHRVAGRRPGHRGAARSRSARARDGWRRRRRSNARAPRPALRHLPTQGAPAARLHPLAARALPAAISARCAGAAGPLRRELLAGARPRAGDGRRHPSLRGGPPGVCRRRLHASGARASSAPAGRSGLRGARAFLEAHLPSDPALFNELHALLVAVAKSHCRTVPHCASCPLRFDLGGRPPAPAPCA